MRTFIRAALLVSTLAPAVAFAETPAPKAPAKEAPKAAEAPKKAETAPKAADKAPAKEAPKAADAPKDVKVKDATVKK